MTHLLHSLAAPVFILDHGELNIPFSKRRQSIEWRATQGFPDYEVSSEGGVRSYKQWRGTRVPRQIAQSLDVRGYPIVKIRNADGSRAYPQVHRLVGMAFFGPLPKDLVTRHLDGNPENNHVSNLRYGTHSENALDTVAHGRNPYAAKTECINGHLFAGENVRWSRSKNGNPTRVCRACRRDSTRKQRAAA